MPEISKVGKRILRARGWWVQRENFLISFFTLARALFCSYVIEMCADVRRLL